MKQLDSKYSSCDFPLNCAISFYFIYILCCMHVSKIRCDFFGEKIWELNRSFISSQLHRLPFHVRSWVEETEGENFSPPLPSQPRRRPWRRRPPPAPMSHDCPLFSCVPQSTLNVVSVPSNFVPFHAAVERECGPRPRCSGACSEHRHCDIIVVPVFFRSSPHPSPLLPKKNPNRNSINPKKISIGVQSHK